MAIPQNNNAHLVYQEPKPLYTHILKFLFGHLGLFILVAAAAASGAYAYIKIESPEEYQRYALKQVRARDIEDAYNYMSSLFWHFQGENMTFPQWDRKVKTYLKTMEGYIIAAVENYNYDGTVTDWNFDWTFPKALLFTITIMTTIGYGHIAPKTSTGQLFTIFYAMVATPMLLVFLANIGDTMASTFRLTYSRICCRWCRSRRYQSEAGFGRKVKRLADDSVGNETYMPTSEVMVPITINLVLIAFYLVMGAALFSAWEGWDSVSSCYFSFVTLATIGFGDMVPGNSFLDYKDGGSAAFKMVVTILYCVFGMALISMCIQMMQEQIVAKVRWMAMEAGLIESDEKAAQPKVKYKKTMKGMVPETPVDADGNMPRAGSGEKKKKKKKKSKHAQDKEREEASFDNAPTEKPEVEDISDASEKINSTDRLIDEELAASS